MSSLAPTVPVYVTAFHGDAEALDTLLLRLKAELGGVPLAVLASDEEALASVAAVHGVPLRAVLPAQADDERYWCQLLEVLGDETGPLIVLRSGTELPSCWYGRMQPQADREPALYFPLCLRHASTSIFADPARSSSLDVTALDTWLNLHAPGKVFDLPALSGWSAWLQPARCRRVKAADDPQLARVLIEVGELLLATDAVVVDDGRFEAQQLPAPYAAWQDARIHHHPLAVMRHAMGERESRAEEPPAHVPATKPVRLHLSHGWGGGLWRWVEDFCTADTACHNFILRPIGEPDGFCKALALHTAGHAEPVATWTLARPILSTALSHHEYTAVLREIITTFQVNALFVSSLIGHSLDALRTGLPTTLVLHDFYPLCPLIMASWNGPCSQCSDTRLADCLQHNSAQRFFELEPPSYWPRLRAEFVALLAGHPLSPIGEHTGHPLSQIPGQSLLAMGQSRVATGQSLELVAPTPSVARRWQQLAPSLDPARFHVIPHGLPAALVERFVQTRRPAGDASERERLRVLILGSLEAHKGGTLLREALPALRSCADFILLGTGTSGEAFAGEEGVEVLAEYRREELAELVAQQEADLGLLLSTVPETFSYTLSELLAAGIPVVATALGAFDDRIVQDESGWLIEPTSDALIAKVQELHADRGRIRAVRRKLLDEAPRSALEMVEDYAALPGAALAPAVCARLHPWRWPEPEPALIPQELTPAEAEASEEVVESSDAFPGETVAPGTGSWAPLRVLRRLFGD